MNRSNLIQQGWIYTVLVTAAVLALALAFQNGQPPGLINKTVYVGGESLNHEGAGERALGSLALGGGAFQR